MDLGQGDFVKVDCAACHHIAADARGAVDDQPEPSRQDARPAIKLSVDATVTVVDSDWRTVIIQILNEGRNALPKHKRIDELFASFSATLVELVFLQLGHLPSNATLVSNSSTREVPIKLQRTVPLKPEYWTLRRFRSVQYVQTHQQHDNIKEYLGKEDKSRRRVKE